MVSETVLCLNLITCLHEMHVDNVVVSQNPVCSNVGDQACRVDTRHRFHVAAVTVVELHIF